MGIAMGVMAGMGALQSYMGAQGAKSEAQAQQAQFEEQEFQRKWQNQVENRNIAKANAAKWMQNRRISASANKTRAEQEFWAAQNFDNASGYHGKQTKNLNDQLLSRLSGRGVNPNSGTARSILRQTTEASQESAKTARLNHANQLVTIERKQGHALASRNFGFNEQIPFMDGVSGAMDPNAAFNMSLATGLVGTAGSMAGAYFAGRSTQGAAGDANTLGGASVPIPNSIRY
jgi:hypothetical protein